MKQLVRTLVVAIVTVLCSALLTACLPAIFYDGDGKASQAKFTKLVERLDERDVNGLKSLFAPEIVKNIQNFDDACSELLSYYQGTHVSFKSGGTSTDEANDYGKKTKDYSMSYDVTTTDDVFRLSVLWRVTDDKVKGNVGIWSLSILRYDDDPFKSYSYHGDGDAEYGIDVGRTYKAKYMYRYNWTGADGKIQFSTPSRGVGSGTVSIGGKPVEAQFSFGDGFLEVSAFVSDLNGYTDGERLGVVSERFPLGRIDGDGRLSSTQSVTLFGECLGNVTLTFSEYDLNRVCEPWEEYYFWGCNRAVKDGGAMIFSLETPCRGYFKRKCYTARLCDENGNENGKAIFKWLDGNRFALYDYDGRGFVDEGAETLAEGTYVRSAGVGVDLTFTKNGIWNCGLDGASMSYDFSEVRLPQ